MRTQRPGVDLAATVMVLTWIAVSLRHIPWITPELLPESDRLSEAMIATAARQPTLGMHDPCSCPRFSLVSAEPPHLSWRFGCRFPKVTGVTDDSKLPRGGALLVIGYGNTLRRDDGVGPKVAEAVAALSLPEVGTLAIPQLTPELAEDIARADRVVFVDAAVDSPQVVRFRKLTPAKSSQIMAHAADPSTMLALARDVFGRAPEAWWLTIPVEDLGFGEELSALAKAGFETALGQIHELVTRPAKG